MIKIINHAIIKTEFEGLIKVIINSIISKEFDSMIKVIRAILSKLTCQLALLLIAQALGPRRRT